MRLSGQKVNLSGQKTRLSGHGVRLSGHDTRLSGHDDDSDNPGNQPAIVLRQLGLIGVIRR